MEYTLMELLSRDDIIRILNARHLHIDNIEARTLTDLLSIYKRFVLPRASRESKRRASSGSINVIPPVPFDNNGAMARTKRSAAMEVDETEEKRNLNINEQPPMIELSEKRQLVNIESADTYLSSVAKRIRIDLS